MDGETLYHRLAKAERRAKELEEALAYQRQLTQAERQRADRMEEAARRAWQVGLPPVRRVPVVT